MSCSAVIGSTLITVSAKVVGTSTAATNIETFKFKTSVSNTLTADLAVISRWGDGTLSDFNAAKT